MISNNRPGLLIDAALGMAGDMFSAALLSLGVPEKVIVGAMELAGARLGRVAVLPERVPAAEVTAVKLGIQLEPFQDHLPASLARRLLEESISAVELAGEFAGFARRALEILIAAERQAHEMRQMMVGTDHHHHDEEAVLHEAQDILIDVVGAAAGLQYLNIDLAYSICLSPVRVGGGYITFSHGRLPVPAPAVRVILERYAVPFASGPVEKELLTPTGASLLAALQPVFRPRDGASLPLERIGIGRGLRRMEPPGDLRLGLLKRNVTETV